MDFAFETSHQPAMESIVPTILDMGLWRATLKRHNKLEPAQIALEKLGKTDAKIWAREVKNPFAEGNVYSYYLDTPSGIFSRTESDVKECPTSANWFEGIYFDQFNYSYGSVIPPNTPVNLVFDIDADLKENPTFGTTIEIAPIIIRKANELLMAGAKHGEIDIEPVDGNDWHVLDSSNKDKTSFHLILASPRAPLFASHNVGAKWFAENLVRKWELNQSKDEEWKRLSVNKNGKNICCIDLSIYTKNRNFRCAWNTKCKPDTEPRPLKPLLSVDDVAMKEQVFLQNLVSCGPLVSLPRTVIPDPPEPVVAKASRKKKSVDNSTKADELQLREIINYCMGEMRKSNPNANFTQMKEYEVWFSIFVIIYLILYRLLSLCIIPTLKFVHIKRGTHTNGTIVIK